MPSAKKQRYRVAVNHVVTVDPGRQYGPGDEIDDLVRKGSDHNEQLVASGQLVEIGGSSAPKSKPTSKTSEGDSKK